jgi:hypothetical protein
MPGLVPGIHVFLASLNKQDVDGRDKPGHDRVCYLISDSSPGMPRSERPGVTVRIIITRVST